MVIIILNGCMLVYGSSADEKLKTMLISFLFRHRLLLTICGFLQH